MAIQDLMNSIAQMEGFNTPGTIAQRNNNPGNLRYAPTQIGSENTVNGTFATFATPQDGYSALQSYIQNKASSGDTLRSFIYTYAPPSENNTSNYLNYLSGQLGVGADASLSEVLGGSSMGTGNSLVDSGNSSSVLSDFGYSTDGQGTVNWALWGLGALAIYLIARN